MMSSRVVLGEARFSSREAGTRRVLVAGVTEKRECIVTSHRHLKQLVRVRMAKIGERYAAARRHIVAQLDPPRITGPIAAHLPGSVPATTALRVLLHHAGLTNPVTRRPSLRCRRGGQRRVRALDEGEVAALSTLA